MAANEEERMMRLAIAASLEEQSLEDRQVAEAIANSLLTMGGPVSPVAHTAPPAAAPHAISGVVRSVTEDLVAIRDALPPSPLKGVLAELCPLLSTTSVGAIMWCSRKVVEVCVAELYRIEFRADPGHATLSAMLSSLVPRLREEVRQGVQTFDIIRDFGNAATHEVVEGGLAADLDLVLVALKRVVEYTRGKMSRIERPRAPAAAAAAPAGAPPSAEDDELICCAICMEPMTDPRTATCGHSFCSECLVGHMDANGPVCPMCRADLPTTMPATNIALQNLIERIRNTPATTTAPAAPLPAAARAPRAPGAGGYAGDWLCPNCGDHQFARNVTCRRCGCLRTEDAAPAPHGPAAFGAAPGGGGRTEWACAGCGVSNFASRDTCRGCGAAAPGAAGAAAAAPPPASLRGPATAPTSLALERARGGPGGGDWNCPTCGDHQFARNAVCRRCGGARPAGAGAAPAAAVPLPVAAAIPAVAATPAVAGGGGGGDWNCPTCGDHQFARNTVCRRCGGARPAAAGAAFAAAVPLPVAAIPAATPAAVGGGDWNCPACNDHQFARNTACRRCGTPRPGAAAAGAPAGAVPTARPVHGHAADWNCPSCGDRQFGRNVTCRRCGTGNPVSDAAAAGHGGDWTCPGCGDHQFARNTECRRCRTPRPHVAASGGSFRGRR